MIEKYDNLKLELKMKNEEMERNYRQHGQKLLKAKAETLALKLEIDNFQKDIQNQNPSYRDGIEIFIF